MRHSTRRGLSAIQLLYALGVVLAGAFIFYSYADERAETGKRSLTIKRLTAIEAAIEKYCFDCGGVLPKDLGELLARPQEDAPAGWAGPYLEQESGLVDGWGRRFQFHAPGKKLRGSDMRRPYDLASYGKDGCEGGEDLDRDICNWNRSTLIP